MSRWEDLGGPGLEVVDRDVEPRRNDAALVQSAEQLDDDLARPVVVDELKLSDVAWVSGAYRVFA